MAKVPHRSRWIPKGSFHPGGQKGKLHRELGIPTSQTIPKDRLRAATHSSNPTIRRDAIRAETMAGWHHSGATKPKSIFRKG